MPKIIVDPRLACGLDPSPRIRKDGEVYEISAGSATPNIVIKFQTGPLNEAGLNGVFVEDLLVIAHDRLKEYQAGPFPCRGNDVAMAAIERALDMLNRRTDDRIARGVEGTSAP